MKYFVGQNITINRKVKKEDVEKFAELSGDYNPIHLDENYAKETRFGKCIAHGMLSGAYISSILGTDFPGEGTVYVSQNLKFVRPIYIGADIKIKLEIKDIIRDKKAVIKTEIIDCEDNLLVSGAAEVLLPQNN